jgi:hypothetical protein
VRSAIAVAAVALLLVACGDNKSSSSPSSGSSPAGVDQACVDLSTWSVAAQKAYNDLQEISQFNATDKEGAQAELTKLKTDLDAADQATATLIRSLQAGGPLDISSGEDVKQALIDALNMLRQAAASARTKIAAFDVQTATPEQSAKLKTDLDELRTTVTESITGLAPLLSSNSELNTALQNSAACRQAGASLFSNSDEGG